jgi:hypothetical protein
MIFVILELTKLKRWYNWIPYSESRTVLLKKWRIKEGISEEKEY